MAHLVTTSGPTLLVYLRDGIDTNETTVRAATLVILIMHTLHRLLEITTTVNQAIQKLHLSMAAFIPMIDSGMASSVKVCVAAMVNLLRGSVWSYQIQQLMILRCVFALQRALILMMSLYNCWNYTSNENMKDISIILLLVLAYLILVN
jgi:hypothetical protein